MSKYFKALTPETIQEVIRLAEDRRNFSDAEAAKLPSRSISVEELLAMLAEEPYKTTVALEDKLRSLTDDQNDELLALMWLGHGAAGATVEMWSDLLEDARQEDVESKIVALMVKSHLGSDLAKGLELYGVTGN